MTNVSLADVQRQVQDFLLAKSQDALTLTSDTPTFSRTERLDIYFQAYRIRLLDALRNDYPALLKTLGEAAFCETCEAFLAQHPSCHPSLRWLGQKLPEFLRAHPNWGKQHHIVELAEFEWAQAMAFDAADTPSLPLDVLSSILPEQWLALCLRLHPALQQMSCQTNAPQIWQTCQQEDAPCTPEHLSETEHWLIWREDLQIVYRSLSLPEAQSLQAFREGKSFSDICEILCDHFEPDQVPPHAARYLQQWLRDGLVTELVVS